MRLQTSANTPDGDADDGDPFISIIKKYASFATAETQRLKDLLDTVDTAFKSLLAYLKIKPGKGQVTESDELFTLLHDFAESFKALLPKPKPLLKGRTAGNLGGATDRVRASVDAGDGSDLDPMLSRIQGVYSTERISDAAAATLGRTNVEQKSRVPSISELARARAPSITEKARASLRSEGIAPPKRESAAVDINLQQRLAARFERAKAQPAA